MAKNKTQLPDSMKPIQDLLDVPEECRSASDTTRTQRIGPFLFNNKKELAAYCETILAGLNHGDHITGSDSHFLIMLFKIGTKDPASSETWTSNRLNEKLEGQSIKAMQYFQYTPDFPAKNGNHLKIIRDDGKEFFLPWREACQHGSTGMADPKKAQAVKDRKFVQAALRSAVDCQTFGFRQQEKKAGRYFCAVSGEPLTDQTGIEVDHHPVQFKTILANWLADTGHTLDGLAITDPLDGKPQVKDPDILKHWRKFHKEHATLRLLTKAAHKKETARQRQADKDATTD